MHSHGQRMRWCTPCGTCNMCSSVGRVVQVASSFSHMLNLHNLTEEVANTQTERAGRMGEVRASSCV